MKKTISLLLAVIMLISFNTAVLAENVVDANIHAQTNNILIEGKLTNSTDMDVVTVLMMKGTELKYINEFPLNEDGTYICKYKFTMDDGTEISDYSLKVNAGRNNVTDTVTKVTNGDLYEFEIKCVNKYGDKYIDFTGETKAVITVTNKYGDEGSIPVLFAKYNGADYKGLETAYAAFGFDYKQVIEVEKTLATDFTLSKLMIWNSIKNMRPLAKAVMAERQTYGADILKKTKEELIKENEKITIVTMQASVTQGAHSGNNGSNHTNMNINQSDFIKYGWAGRTINTYFADKYGEENVEYLSAAIGGTNTRQMLYRLQRDVLAHKPDVVFVDAPINDTWSNDYDVAAFTEGIVRQLLKAKHQPVIVLNCVGVFTASSGVYTFTDKSSDTAVKNKNLSDLLTEKYGLVQFDFYSLMEDAINDSLGAKKTDYLIIDGAYVGDKLTAGDDHSAWDVFMYDGIHPNRVGHGLYANYAVDVLKNTDLTAQKHTKTFDEPLSGYEYNNPHMISWKEATEKGMAVWSDGWNIEEGKTYTSTNYTVCDGLVWSDGANKATSAGESVTFAFNGTAIGIYGRRGNSFAAAYDIDNGKYTGTFKNDGADKVVVPWEIHGLEDGEHTITITTTDNNESDEQFTIAYFLVDCE